MRMRHFAAIVTFLFFSICFNDAPAQSTGETTFTQTCAACHTVGRGRLVGPDLANVSQRHSEDWIIKFVKSSQSVIKSGDPYADSLYKAFNQTLMPDHPALTDGQIKDVIAYIQTKGTSSTTGTPNGASETSGQKTAKPADTIFSTTNIFLLGLIGLMLLVILHLWKTNKSLADQIRDYYSSNKSFFK